MNPDQAQRLFNLSQSVPDLTAALVAYVRESSEARPDILPTYWRDGWFVTAVRAALVDSRLAEKYDLPDMLRLQLETACEALAAASEERS